MIKDFNLYCGSAWSWTDSFDDYPASLFNCILYLKLGTAATVTITPTKSVDSFIFTKPSSETAALANGDYSYQYLFTEIADSTNKQVLEGTVPIKALLTSTADPRSDDQKVLDALKAARLTIAGRDYVTVNINGKSTQFKTLEEIEAAIIRYQKRLGIYKTPRLINSFG
ncbi:MAG: hypothetical protein WC879_03445 [Melioribacteraceae bacterium]